MPLLTYHLTIDLLWALRASDAMLTGLVCHAEHGDPMAPAILRRLAAHYYRRGYTVLPMCSCTDATGRCLGHAQEPADGELQP